VHLLVSEQHIKRMITHGLPQTYNLDKQTLIPYKALRTFSVCLSVAIKHFARSDGINQP